VFNINIRWKRFGLCKDTPEAVCRIVASTVRDAVRDAAVLPSGSHSHDPVLIRVYRIRVHLIWIVCHVNARCSPFCSAAFYTGKWNILWLLSFLLLESLPTCVDTATRWAWSDAVCTSSQQLLSSTDPVLCVRVSIFVCRRKMPSCGIASWREVIKDAVSEE